MTDVAAPGRIGQPPLTIVLPQRWRAEDVREQSARGEIPTHMMLTLADELGGRVVTAAALAPSRLDRLLGLALGSDEVWALARKATRGRSTDELYYANSEEVGLAITLLQALRRRPTRRVGFYLQVPDGHRIRWWLRLISVLRLDPMIVVTTPNTYDGAERFLRRRGRRIALIRSPLDLEFFAPTRKRADNPRPLLASAGMERRDYTTLLAAVAEMDVDLVVCAVSQNAQRSSASFPDTVPDNVSFEPLSMAGLRDLYQRADATIVACLPNTIDAGTTVAIEAGACACPLLVSHTSGLVDYVDDGVAADAGTGDPAAMRAAIRRVLDSPDEAQAMSQRGLQRIRERYAASVFHDRYIRLVYPALQD